MFRHYKCSYGANFLNYNVKIIELSVVLSRGWHIIKSKGLCVKFQLEKHKLI